MRRVLTLLVVASTLLYATTSFAQAPPKYSTRERRMRAEQELDQEEVQRTLAEKAESRRFFEQKKINRLKDAIREEVKVKILMEEVEREERAKRAPQPTRILVMIQEDLLPVMIFALWLFFIPYFAAALAKGKGRSRVGWTLLGLLFGPLAWLVVALPRKQKTSRLPPTKDGGPSRPAPQSKQPVHKDEA